MEAKTEPSLKSQGNIENEAKSIVIIDLNKYIKMAESFSIQLIQESGEKMFFLVRLSH